MDLPIFKWDKKNKSKQILRIVCETQVGMRWILIDLLTLIAVLSRSSPSEVVGELQELWGNPSSSSLTSPRPLRTRNLSINSVCNWNKKNIWDLTKNIFGSFYITVSVPPDHNNIWASKISCTIMHRHNQSTYFLEFSSYKSTSPFYIKLRRCLNQ